MTEMHQREILFGAAYYAEYMPYDRVEEDLRMMKDAGMNVIRIAESTWSTLEPEEGRFDFHYIDRVLEAAERAEMRVIIGTPTYAVPSWLEKLDPDVLVTTKKGRALYGFRQLMDITNETYLYYAERVIRKLLEHTAEHPCVIGFQIDNETKHYGTAGPKVQEGFRKYLEERFGTPQKLNETFHLAYWSNSIHTWEDLPDMRGCINGGLSGEFEAYQRKLAADFLAWQASIVQEYRREEHFITHNLDFEWKKFGADIAQDGYSYGVQPDLCHWEAAKCLTLAGTDVYHPTQDELTGAEIAFGGDSIRSLKGENYMMLECQAQAFKYWTPYPGQLRLQAYSHLASGSIGLMYWNWHSIHNGYETYWKGLLSHDLGPNATYGEACVIGEEWKRLGREKLVLRKDCQAALVIDNRSLISGKWFPIDRDLSYNDVVRWMYDSLYEMNIPCDVVDAAALEPERYRMIVTPDLYCVRQELVDRLDRFVKAGGVLVSSFRSFVANEYMTVWHDAQPHGLTACFGMSYNQHTEPRNLRIDGAPVTYFAELLKVDTAESLADYEHKYWGSYAGITKNSYGEGNAYYIGCFTEKDVLKKLFRQAAADAGIRYTEALSWPLIERGGVNGEGRRIHYLFNYSCEDRRAVNPFGRVRDLLTDRIYEKEEPVDLKDWGVSVLEEIAD